MIKSIKAHPIAAFFILSSIITWTFQLSGIFLALRSGMTISNEANFLNFVDALRMRLPAGQFLALGVFTLGAGPLFSAVLLTGLLDGKKGLRLLWKQTTKWKLGTRWYLITLGVPVLLSVVSVGLGALASAGKVDYSPRLPLSNFIPFFLYMIVVTGVSEEPGWRGFALPRLQARYSAEKSSWILGVLWGVWHFPFIIYYNYGNGLIPLLFSLLGLTLGIVGWSIVNTWIYNNTGSVFLIILLHGWGNTVHSYLVLSSNNYMAQTLYGVLPWIIALIVLRVYGKENLAHSERPKIPRNQST